MASGILRLRERPARSAAPPEVSWLPRLASEALDPLWARLGVAGLLGGLVPASFVSRFVRDHFVTWLRGALFFVMIWLVATTALNHFNGEHALGLVLGYAIIVAFVGVSAQSGRPVAWFSVFSLVLVAGGVGASYAAGPGPEISPLVLLAGIAGASLAEGVAIHRLLSMRQALRNREEQLHVITGNVSEEHYRSTSEDGLVYANQAFEEMTGYREDGTPYVAHWNTTAVQAEEVEVEYRASIQRDVTDRCEMEERLREQRSRLQGMANSIPGVTYQFYVRPDGERGCHFVGKHAAEMLGLPTDPEAFRDQFDEHIPAPHRARLLDAIDDAIEAEAPWRIELPFDRPSGDRIWLLDTAIPERRNGELVFNGVMIDITRRKAAERALRDERDRFESLFKSLPTPIIRCTVEDDTSYVSMINEAFEDTFGVEAEAVEGTDIDTVIVPDDAEHEGAALNRRAVEEGALKTEVRRLTDERRRPAD